MSRIPEKARQSLDEPTAGEAETSVWFACGEDVDAALDEAIDASGTAPDLSLLEDREAASCFWCGGPARYRVEVTTEAGPGEGGGPDARKAVKNGANAS
ncbi:CxxH/CxxC protein [Staphylospora marina]|uniref:CxxH/CxxC protein n=1 Tax=Staphylospora marina TaxID=2490858 RepID=UPI000F5C18CB|nr:CxxH/CxxC protein [Staphylospora marina]